MDLNHIQSSIWKSSIAGVGTPILTIFCKHKKTRVKPTVCGRSCEIFANHEEIFLRSWTGIWVRVSEGFGWKFGSRFLTRGLRYRHFRSIHTAANQWLIRELPLDQNFLRLQGLRFAITSSFKHRNHSFQMRSSYWWMLLNLFLGDWSWTDWDIHWTKSLSNNRLHISIFSKDHFESNGSLASSASSFALPWWSGFPSPSLRAKKKTIRLYCANTTNVPGLFKETDKQKLLNRQSKSKASDNDVRQVGVGETQRRNAEENSNVSHGMKGRMLTHKSNVIDRPRSDSRNRNWLKKNSSLNSARITNTENNLENLWVESRGNEAHMR